MLPSIVGRHIIHQMMIIVLNSATVTTIDVVVVEVVVTIIHVTIVGHLGVLVMMVWIVDSLA